MALEVSKSGSTTGSSGARIDLDKPRWDQSTFMGRLRHFAWMTDYRTCLTPTAKLQEAKALVEKYKYVITNVNFMMVTVILSV